MTANEKLENSALRVSKWVEDRNYKGYEPADGNASFLYHFTFGNIFLQRVLQQSVIRAPFNIRPILGIPPLECTKARGYMAWAYVLMHQRSGEEKYRERANTCLDWLVANPSPDCGYYAWGNHYHFATRGGKIPRLAPTIVWTSLIGEAFLVAYEAWGNPRHLEVAANICEWIMSLPRERTSSGTCLSYVAFKQASIHNSNMLGAAMLARVGKLTDNRLAMELAREAMEYSCSRQNSDGSWYYGDDPKYQWIDNFHTGYNLDSLKRYRESAQDRTYDEHLRRGFSFFKSHFFESNGCPRYFHNKTLPIDIQCAAQGIDTLTYFADQDESLALARKVAGWTIDHMQDQDGHFYYRNFGWALNKTPLLHWGQASMFKALAYLLTKTQTSGTQPSGWTFG